MIREGSWAEAFSFQPLHFLLVGTLVFLSAHIFLRRRMSEDPDLHPWQVRLLLVSLAGAFGWNNLFSI